tara:strand:- start:1238 stop:1891 length:654 start_codon:yes stop_codon:yes gene_type:complete
MIDWQLESLKEIQDKEFIFIVGAKKEEVEDYLTKKNLGKVTFLNNNNYKSTNCGYSLSLALPLIKDEWIYLNSDLFFEKAMTSMFKKFLGINGVCVHYGQPTDLHTFTLSPNKYIEKWMPIDTGQTTKEDLIGRPKADGEIVGPILGKMNLASDLLTIFNNLNKKRKETISCYTLFSLVEDAKYSTIDISNFIWKEIDTKNDYYLAEKLIKDNYLDK